MALEPVETSVLQSYIAGLRGGDGAKLSDEARRFLCDVVTEALEHRLAEDPALECLSRPESGRRGEETLVSKALRGTIGASLGRIVASAHSDRSEGGIALIDILEVVHLEWCNIWPFCRPPERPDEMSVAAWPAQLEVTLRGVPLPAHR